MVSLFKIKKVLNSKRLIDKPFLPLTFIYRSTREGQDTPPPNSGLRKLIKSAEGVLSNKGEELCKLDRLKRTPSSIDLGLFHGKDCKVGRIIIAFVLPKKSSVDKKAKGAKGQERGSMFQMTR